MSILLRGAVVVGTLLLAFSRCSTVRGELLAGAASVEITPEEPVVVTGQFRLRISERVETPLTANVMVLESRRGSESVETSIMVSCDVIGIPVSVLELVRQKVQERLPAVDTSKIFLSGTHTHTAPELRLGCWVLPERGVMTVEQYREYFADRVATGIAEAWQARGPATTCWGLGHAVVGYNRRAVYADGTAKMYGATNVAGFRGLEGYEDHDVGMLFVWNESGKLIAAAVNVACPSQEVESRSTLNADFWHPVREQLRSRHGEDLVVLGWCGAAGDQSPHLMYRKSAEERMRALRGMSRLEEIARRIVNAVDDVYDAVKDHAVDEVQLTHKVETIQLPMRLVTQSEYEEAKAGVAEAAAQIKQDAGAAERVFRRMKWYETTVNRYEQQATNPHPTLGMELHVVRIGDAVVCTNQFELFTEFGIRMKARSRAAQTFVIQLAGPGTYLPTAEAVRGGHYSAVVHSCLVGPEGGQTLVDRTVELIDSLWETPSE